MIFQTTVVAEKNKKKKRKYTKLALAGQRVNITATKVSKGGKCMFVECKPITLNDRVHAIVKSTRAREKDREVDEEKGGRKRAGKKKNRWRRWRRWRGWGR